LKSFELDKTSLLAVIISLLADELKALRHQTSHQIGSEQWDESTLIGEARADSDTAHDPIIIGADSLELVSLATCVATFFNIYDSGVEDYLLRLKTLGEWAELVAVARDRGSRKITFATSGSTGSPKQCHHQWNSLVNETLLFAARLGPGSERPTQRIIALSPCHHIYGFIFSVLLAAQLKVPVLRGPQALSAIQQGALHTGDVIIGFPFIWRQLNRQGARFAAGVTGITSTGPCDPEAIRMLKSQGLERMIEVYGSSETAGIGFRQQPEQPFQLLPRWQRGTSDDCLLELDSETEHELSDYLHWQDASHFRPAGRRDEAVQVGGVNVFPGSIAERLQCLPQIASTAVRLMSAAEGERLKAFIVPTGNVDSADTLESFLHAWCAENLSAPERPKAFTFGSSLPRNAMGKLSDWLISASMDADF
jgi:long-chain acyl-CoA synthetase